MSRHPQSKSNQHGVAIITALLIMAIVAAISVTLARHMMMNVRRTGNIIANEQALMYISGAEEFAKYGLKLDRQNNTTDNDYELRAQPRTFPFVGGTLTGIIKGQQGCFNINNLVNSAGKPDALAKQRFQLLLSTLKLNPGLADAVIDWIDPDLDTTLPDGAEDGYYTNLPKPYRAANQAMQSLSELRLVKGFNDLVPTSTTGATSVQHTVYETIAPFVCAFGVPASINVNTAPAEVLRSLSPNLTQKQAETIAANVKSLKDPATGEVVGYSSVTDMIKLNNLSTVITNTTGLSVTTDYFLLTSTVTTSQSHVQMFSLLYRDPNSGETRVLRHSIGAY